MMDADASKAFVIAALQRLVDDDLAEWDRTADGEWEIRLLTGETLVVGDSGITAKTRAASRADPERFGRKYRSAKALR